MPMDVKKVNNSTMRRANKRLFISLLEGQTITGVELH